MTLIAHASHWASSIVFLGPTLGFVGWLTVSMLRERRRTKAEADAAASD